jgi:hypothetical protein
MKNRFDLRNVRLALALAVTSLAIFASVALASGGGQPTVLPVEPDGGIGGEVILPVEPDGSIGN